MFETEDNQLNPGLLDSLLGAAGRAADIYRNVTQPAPAPVAATPAPVRQVSTPFGAFSPLAIGGAALALVVVLWLALRGK